MDRVKIGYDVNLKLAADFTEKLPCEAVSYTDINKLVADFNDEALHAIFGPAGTLLYLQDYNIISQALYGPQLSLTLTTNFMTAENITIPTIKNHLIGRVNRECTTSFWAPMIYLMDYLPKGTVLNFQNTESFPDMLFKTAAKEVGASMVWDIILNQHPEATSKVHQLFSKNDLPCPLMFAKSTFPAEIKQKINQFRSNDNQTFFRGFCAPDLNAIEKFKNDMQKAKGFFNVITHKDVPLK